MRIQLTLDLEVQEPSAKWLKLMFSGKHRLREREAELREIWLDETESLVDAWILPGRKE